MKSPRRIFNQEFDLVEKKVLEEGLKNRPARGSGVAGLERKFHHDGEIYPV
jgi:hypothetical protein